MTVTVCVFGAGAIGGLIAARLLQAGTVVSLVARGVQLQAIREHGITIQTPDGTTTCVYPERATDDPHEIGAQDIVFVTVKSTALQGVAAQLAPLLSPNTSVVFITNGIPWWYPSLCSASYLPLATDAFDPEAALHRAVDLKQVIGGTIYTACTVTEPGVIRTASSSGLLVLGEVEGSGYARSAPVADLLRKAGLACRVTDNMRAEVWSKLMMNLAGATICLLTRRSFAQSYSDPVIRSAAIRVVEEGLAVAAAVLEHPLKEDAGEIVARLATLEHKPSILQDFELGRPMEIDALLTRPHQLAQMTHVETPMLDLLTALARQSVGLQAGSPAPCDDRRKPPLAVLDAHHSSPVLEQTVGKTLRVAAACWNDRIALQEGTTAAPCARQ